MGFLNNTTVTVDAILTKKGRELLAQGTEAFNITKFALADDEIDYTLWDAAHPKGTDYYGAVLESTPMLEPCVDPEVVMKYKLITMPVGTKALPYINNVTPTSLLGDNALETQYNPDFTPAWTFSDHLVNPNTQGADGAFSAEKYSFLVLNKNVVDIATGQGENVNFDVGAVYNEESGRTSKKVIDNVATIRTGPGTVGTSRETSIIITGQMSGAVYVLPVKVNYIDNTPT